MASQWTKRCPGSHSDELRPYIADDRDVCDACVIVWSGLWGRQKSLPACVDPLGTSTIYEEEDVLPAIHALHKRVADLERAARLHREVLESRAPDTEMPDQRRRKQ